MKVILCTNSRRHLVFVCVLQADAASCLNFVCLVRRDPVNLNYFADMVKKQRNAPINEFEISHDSSSKTWHVQGLGLQRFVQMTNWRWSWCGMIMIVQAL